MAVKYLSEEAEEIFSQEDKLLYRVFAVDRLIEILETNKWPFVSPTLWPDPFEKAFLLANYIHSGNHFYLPIRPTKDKKGLRTAYTLYSSCWTQTSESEAFWKTYAPNGDGIRISVKVQELIKFLSKVKDYDVYIGKADYEKPDDLYKFKGDTAFWKELMDKKTNLTHLKLMLKKRDPFKYENEIRIMLLRKKPMTRSLAKVLCRTPERIIDSIMLDPRMGIFTSELITDGIVEKYGIDRSIIARSDLYSVPKKSINFEPLNLIENFILF